MKRANEALDKRNKQLKDLKKEEVDSEHFAPDEHPRFLELWQALLETGKVPDLAGEDLKIWVAGCEMVKVREKAIAMAKEAGAQKREDPGAEIKASANSPTFNLAIKDGERGVDLRELHRELGSKQEFAHWASTKLSQFVKGQDFVSLDNVIKRSVRGGHNRIDYAVSIECAKHIAMMEQTERGRQVRQYFIDFEKAVREKEQQLLAVPQTLPDALRLAADLAEKNETLSIEVADLKPKAEPRRLKRWHRQLWR